MLSYKQALSYSTVQDTGGGLRRQKEVHQEKEQEMSVAAQFSQPSTVSWGPGKVSCIEKCPHFLGRIFMKGHSKVSLFQRCPFGGSTVSSLIPHS